MKRISKPIGFYLELIFSSVILVIINLFCCFYPKEKKKMMLCLKCRKSTSCFVTIKLNVYIKGEGYVNTGRLYKEE